MEAVVKEVLLELLVVRADAVAVVKTLVESEELVRLAREAVMDAHVDAGPRWLNPAVMLARTPRQST